MNDETLKELGLTVEAASELEAILADREAEEVGVEAALEGAEAAEMAAPAVLAASVSSRAFDLIVEYETGGYAYYDKVIKRRPIWPGLRSGVTIGFGYDLGYVSEVEFRQDWGILQPNKRERLVKAVGKHGGNTTVSTLTSLITEFNDIVVEWDTAKSVFKAASLPKFAARTFNSLPNCALLSSDCFGVLVSLTFNRGASYAKAHDPAKDPIDRYREMRAIKAAMTDLRLERVPGIIRDMKRIWKGTDIEKGMTRRREDEAKLFEAGLAARDAVVAAGPRSLGARPAVAMESMTATAPVGGAIPPDAEVWDGPGDEDFFQDVTEDDIAEAAQSGRIFEAAADVEWAPDAESFDYAHLGVSMSQGSFTLRADDLALLAEMNSFPVEEAGDTPVLFGLRGCGIIKDHATTDQEVTLTDQRPDHRTPRCTLGVWNRQRGTIQVFPGSTVPNAKAVIGWFRTRQAGNQLPTGLYRYIVGVHNERPGCFVLRKSENEKRVVVVRRSSNDLRYDVKDVVERCAPGDNIHPTFSSGHAVFSSFGCQTIVGTAEKRTGKHAGPWAAFRKAAGLTTDDGQPGKPYLYMLLTGAEARLASGLRADGLTGDPVSRRRIRRLRIGSKGPRVKALQAKLGLPNQDETLGPLTAEKLHAFQGNLPPGGRSDGIWTPQLDTAFGWGIFGSIGA